MVMFRRQHPKLDQNAWFVPKTTSISQPLQASPHIKEAQKAAKLKNKNLFFKSALLILTANERFLFN